MEQALPSGTNEIMKLSPLGLSCLGQLEFASEGICGSSEFMNLCQTAGAPLHFFYCFIGRLMLV